jgi:hypothetical protein
VFFDPGLRVSADSRRLLGTPYKARGHHCMVSPVGLSVVIPSERDYIIPFRAFFRARFFAASAFFLRLTDGFS